MTKVEQAILLAVQAHAGQLDKVGQPYIYHPLRVGLAGSNDNEKIVGFLHDGVEDTHVGLEWIRQEFGSVIANAVDAMTRRGEGSAKEPYDDYIGRVCANSIAARVKWRDIKDNLSRMKNLPKEDRLRLCKKYYYARTQLMLLPETEDLRQPFTMQEA